MKTLLNNLYLYEVVLLFLGILLFLILCVALFYSLRKGQNIKRLLLFFVISIIMIGYPSIQEIQIEKDKIAIKKYKDRVKENPNDTVAVKKLGELIYALEGRAKTSKDLAQISEAYLLVEEPEKAIKTADKAIEQAKRSTKKGSLNNAQMITLDNYKKAANIQKEITTLKATDSTVLKDQMKEIKTLDPKTRNFLTKKYRPRLQKKKN